MARMYNRCFRTTDEQWRRFNAAAFARDLAVSDVLRDAIDQFCDQEGEWRV